MDFKKILSGKDKPQILHLGFRLQLNKGPKGPNNTSYFRCVNKDCKATLATLGPIEGDLTLKYHHHMLHNHRADVSGNIVSETMHEFRRDILQNPECSAKQLFENVSTKALESVSGTPNKLAVAKKLPTYRHGNKRAIVQNL